MEVVMRAGKVKKNKKADARARALGRFAIGERTVWGAHVNERGERGRA
jgi:hypothetical protein